MSSKFTKTGMVTGAWITANNRVLGVYHDHGKETIDICSYSEQPKDSLPNYAVSIGTGIVNLQTVINGKPVIKSIDSGKFEAMFRAFLAGVVEQAG